MLCCNSMFSLVTLGMFLTYLSSYPCPCFTQGSTGLENLKIIDSLLRNYDRRATPTNTMGKHTLKLKIQIKIAHRYRAMAFKTNILLLERARALPFFSHGPQSKHSRCYSFLASGGGGYIYVHFTVV